MRFPIVGLLVLASMAPAQTFIVDEQSGPGSHYTDIGTAVAAVPDGAVLVVRQGRYDSFTVTAKSITILGAPGARFGATGGITISNLAAGQRVVLRNLKYTTHFMIPGAVTCQNCIGAIQLDTVQQDFGSGPFRLDVDQCAQVQVSNGLFNGTNATPGARIVNSEVHFVDTSLTGRTDFAGGLSGLEQVGGRVQLTNSIVRGGQGIFSPSGHAITMQGGDLRILAGTTLTGGANATQPGLQIDGTGVARIDPSVDATQVAAGITLVPIAMPHLRSSGGTMGAPVTANLGGPAGDIGLISLGIPGGPALVPGWIDPLWIDNPSIIGFAILGAPFVVSVPVPVDLTLEGLAFAWQGLSIDANFAFQVSNAAWFVVRQ